MTAARLGALGLVALACAGAGCSRSGGQPAQTEKPLVGGLGKRLAAGPVADLKLTKDGAFATFLRNPKRLAIQGVSPLMALGELGVASLKDGVVRFIGQGVSNRPGSVLFSPDSRWLFFVDGYNAAAEAGTLHTLQLGSAAEPELRGRAVSFVAVSPTGNAFAFVDGGVLRLAPLQAGSSARAVATEVSTAQFTPDGALLLVHHRAATGGALERVPVEGNHPPVRLGDSVGDWILAPDGKRVAFAVKSTVVRDGRDLWVAALPDGKPVRVVTGTGPFAFSPDGMQLARIEREKASSIGHLVVGPAAGGSGRKVAERVGDFSFAPDGKAVAALANYDEQQKWGRLTYAPLPEGQPVELGRRVTTWVWSLDNRHLAFNLRVFQPLPSVDLWLYTRGKPSASAVMANVYGYDFGPGGSLYLRSECIREARACTLERLDPSIPDGKPTPVLEGIFGFRPSESGNRMLVTYARTDAETYDVAVLNLKTNVRVTLEERILLPALFADPEGTRAVYLVSQGERSGLYVCDQVP
ncbi:MAG TPA: gliding motility protein [Myxococcaceae bacterium]|nr:gliding motility protein [Myxococcaceae bacterium]